MYHIGNDIRQEKSAVLIMGALQTLQTKQPKHKVSITELCNESGVSRSTFYRLFDTVDDVVRCLCDRACDALMRACEERPGASPADVYAMFGRNHVEGIKAVLRYGEIQILMDAHKQALRNHAVTLFPNMDPKSDEFVFFINMRTGMLVGMVQAWIDTNFHTDLQTIADFSKQTVRFLNENRAKES